MMSYSIKALYVLARTGVAVLLVGMGAQGLFNETSTSLWSYFELGTGLAIMLANLFLLNYLAAESLATAALPVAAPWSAGTRGANRRSWGGLLEVSGTVVPLRPGALGR